MRVPVFGSIFARVLLLTAGAWVAPAQEAVKFREVRRFKHDSEIPSTGTPRPERKSIG
jgi:hypothetical protein